MKTYIGDIEKLKPNQIFVFGSNTQGRHGKGSALIALKKFGAKYGQAKGFQGQSYAIITKDLTMYNQPSISKEFIIEQIKVLYKLAEGILSHVEFLIAYKADGVNLNGYSPKAMKEMYFYKEPPKNIIFEEEFSKL